MMGDVGALTLSEFILARITEDEAFVMIGSDSFEESDAILPTTGARVLAECEAKRRIVDLAGEANSLDATVEQDRGVGSRTTPYCGDEILAALALPYADHPDYREEWKP